MKIKEKWKQPVSRSTIWIPLALVVFLICGIIGFSQIVNHSRFERPAWAVMLSVVWFSAIVQFMKPGRRMRQRYPVLFLVGYTLFAVGNIFPQWAAAFWLSITGDVALIGAGVLAFVDLTKSHSPASPEAPPPAT